MVAVLQHYMNPLHIYCRLRDVGLSKRQAIFLCLIYERSIFRFFIVRETVGW